MENELKILLYRIGLTENEADDILNIAPEFENLSAQDFLCNCKILTEYGYPKIDLDSLVLANPSIFTYSETELKEKLEKLKQDGQEIEDTLKNDPFAI